ncbi:hypothetical protein [Gluconobacter aidae]|uniref:Uncharacterized protein n=1 Tax=Gluconobacter aidae TaxID=2662454 RepID=A0A7X1SSV6_9PROT|nr:hypothetical protein [Gluconobacter aidae]MQS00161.1 hypothetical protein [Gluconobacter aidae]
MSHDSTNTPEWAKPEHIEDYFARISRRTAEALTMGEVNQAPVSDTLDKISEIVRDGMGFTFRPDIPEVEEAWRKRVREIFAAYPASDEGDAA